ncbi:DUF3866 family protein [Brassicibacter mesophilus]|uniref:DUF3866 family protein n=1 Tax=Brassicibacter mesophilus TaxID=745119 RepID=UPI003D1EFDE5
MEVFKLIGFKEGIITKILEINDDVSWVEVMIESNVCKAVNYNGLTGCPKTGDSVVLNTTAVDLSLGTGGYHFIIHNNRIKRNETSGKGHIMKLRYTPLQMKCLAAEEEDSLYHDSIKSFNNLNKSIYIVGTLHSMLAPIAAIIKWMAPKLKVNYIMTDAGALPIHFSKTVKQLKEKKIINNTITVGHAFGGDLECVNIYTGLIASDVVLNSDVTIITMGPGIVGTGTKYGFSGIEQGYIIDAVNVLNGTSFAVPRVSFADKRDRHKGISHHTITTMSEITYSRSNLVLPYLEDSKMKIITSQINEYGIDEKHNIIYEEGKDVKAAMDYFGLKVKTMGRDYYGDQEFFMTLGAVGRNTVNFLNNRR